MEKVILDSNMPTLEEIKLRYKNAYSVIGILSMTDRESIIGDIYIYNGGYFGKCRPWDVMIWSKTKGYAVISETKAQRFIRISKRIND